MMECLRWMEGVSSEGWVWYVKYLAGNDTLLTNAHQAGPYIPKQVLFDLFPSIQDPKALNPRSVFPASIDPHGQEVDLTAIWYNNRWHGGTRNECRITNWGGRASPVLDPESTGSLCVFAFYKREDGNAEACRVWLCGDLEEEEAVLDRVGPVEPGSGRLYVPTGSFLSDGEPKRRDSPCRARPDELPCEWLLAFPDAQSILGFAVGRIPSARTLSPDERLLTRRACEFEVFRAVEDLLVLRRVVEGFGTVDLFVNFANTVTNRRKSRSGASLELHSKLIFEEERLPYAYNEESEGGKRPDFLFPSAEAYRDPAFPAEKLRMLAVKTTCKDRWRQVIDEAERVPHKHLLTLQEGISPQQFEQMRRAGVSLVVPKPLHSTYQKEIRGELISFSDFIREAAVRTN